MARFGVLILVLGLPLPAPAQGFGPGPGGVPEINLTEDKVNRLLAALPEVVREAAAQQAAFMQGLAGGAGPAPQLTPEKAARLQQILGSHGYTLEQFAIDVSALMATYFTLDPAAFERQLPTEKTPEVRAILDDPAVPQATKDAVRTQIAEVQKNKHKLVANFAMFASEQNKKVVRPLLGRVAEVLEEARQLSAAPKLRRSEGGPRRGPRREKRPD